MELAISVLTSTTVSGVIAALLVFVTRAWVSERLKNTIKHEYDQRLEALKAILKAQHDVELERLRSQLAMAATEHQVRFASQYDQMATVIEDVYRQTSQLYDAVARYITPAEFKSDGPQSERRERVNRFLKEFSDYFYVKRIYLPSHTADRVESFRVKLHDVAQEFADKVEIPREKTGNWEPMAWSKACKTLSDEIKPLRAELESEFRILLGVSPPPKQEDMDR